jgi:hypothetical protein
LMKPYQRFGLPFGSIRIQDSGAAAAMRAGCLNNHED